MKNYLKEVNLLLERWYFLSSGTGSFGLHHQLLTSLYPSDYKLQLTEKSLLSESCCLHTIPC